MRQSTAEALARAAFALDIECTIYPDYSGRGMFGKETCGIVIARTSTVAALAAQAVWTICDEGQDVQRANDLIQDLRRLSTDNMGHDVIIY